MLCIDCGSCRGVVQVSAVLVVVLSRGQWFSGLQKDQIKKFLRILFFSRFRLHFGADQRGHGVPIYKNFRRVFHRPGSELLFFTFQTENWQRCRACGSFPVVFGVFSNNPSK
jgi:hypothetical protein